MFYYEDYEKLALAITNYITSEGDNYKEEFLEVYREFIETDSSYIVIINKALERINEIIKNPEIRIDSREYLREEIVLRLLFEEESEVFGPNYNNYPIESSEENSEEDYSYDDPDEYERQQLWLEQHFEDYDYNHDYNEDYFPDESDSDDEYYDSDDDYEFEDYDQMDFYRDYFDLQADENGNVEFDGVVMNFFEDIYQYKLFAACFLLFVLFKQ